MGFSHFTDLYYEMLGFQPLVFQHRIIFHPLDGLLIFLPFLRPFLSHLAYPVSSIFGPKLPCTVIQSVHRSLRLYIPISIPKAVLGPKSAQHSA